MSGREKNRPSERNPFEVLCAHASRYGWCWKIPCTTCANQQFRIGLTLIACDLPLEGWLQPRNEWPDWMPWPDWLVEPRGVRPHLNEAEAIRLSGVLAKANLESIRADYKDHRARRRDSPFKEDWLGYLGVGMFRPLFPSEYQEHIGTAWRRQLDQLVGIQSKELRPIAFEELEEYERRLFQGEYRSRV